MPGPQPKPDDRRQRRNRRPSLTVALGGVTPLRIPAAPAGVAKAVRERWDAFWRSEYAVPLKWERDGRAITRLFELYDLHDRYLRAERKQPLVAGSTGQPIANPLGKARVNIASEIRQLEDRFGLNLRTAMQMGVTLTELRQSLEGLIEDADDDSDGDAIETEAREVQ